jgi:hypothetical protein
MKKMRSGVGYLGVSRQNIYIPQTKDKIQNPKEPPSTVFTFNYCALQ